ncbi:hypothetical protein HY992_06030 [Candidatus Micrarchaeota archaeon]|nr:hypothetical protein [Candidatus Micrarchaeota archaeon]
MSEQIQVRESERRTTFRELATGSLLTCRRILSGEIAGSANSLVERIRKKPQLLERIARIVANEKIEFKFRKRFADFLFFAAEKGIDVSLAAGMLAPAIRDEKDWLGTLRKPLVFALHGSMEAHGVEARERVEAAIPEFWKRYSMIICEQLSAGVP